MKTENWNKYEWKIDLIQNAKIKMKNKAKDWD